MPRRNLIAKVYAKALVYMKAKIEYISTTPLLLTSALSTYYNLMSGIEVWRCRECWPSQPVGPSCEGVDQLPMYGSLHHLHHLLFLLCQLKKLYIDFLSALLAWFINSFSSLITDIILLLLHPVVSVTSTCHPFTAYGIDLTMSGV